MRPWATVLVCAGILLGAAAATWVIFNTEPRASRVGATKETAMLVEVTEVWRGTRRPTIVAQGTVQPARDVVLRPRVEGRIVERSPGFAPGGFVEEGAILVRIDPTDYENTLEQRQSELRRAEADLEVEMGRQAIARQDYLLLQRELTPENRALVLREPQLETAKAVVESARAAVAQAQLELRRTRIEAPFDAHILTREVDLGSQVAPGDRLGRIVGLDEYWVVATVPLSKLPWIVIPDAPGERGAVARVRNPAAWPDDRYRTGTVDRLIGALDETTRLARLLITVEDPLARRSDSPEVAGLMIGAFVEARIRARELTDVVRLDRDHVRQGDTAWVLEEGRLAIRELGIEFRDEEHAYVATGLEDGDRVVTTDLSTVVAGSPLRLAPEERDGADPGPVGATQ